MNVDPTSPLKICIERHQSTGERVTAAVVVFGFIALAPAAVFLQDSPTGIIGKTIFVAVAWFILGGIFVGTALADDVRWTIQFGEICIERESVLGGRSVESLATGDISETSIHNYDGEFCIKVRLRSGKYRYSPIVPTETDAKAIKARICTWLQVETAH